MSIESQDGLFKSLFRMPRYAPAWFAAFLAGLLLLFLKDLPEVCSRFLVPSLVVYSLGAAILGTIHRLLAISYDSGKYLDNESPIPVGWRITLLVSHLAWFSAPVIYNGWRGVL